MFGKKHDDGTGEATAAPPPDHAAQPLWTDIPETCEACGARIDQAEACFAFRPICHYCQTPLACRPVAAPIQQTFHVPGATGPFGGMLNAAMGALLRHQVNAIYGPGGAIEQYDANVRTYGVTAFGGYDYLRTAGVPYRGRLVDWTKKGMYDSRGMLMELEIELERSDGYTAMVRCESMVPDAHRHAMAQGMPLDVRVDPNDWSAMLIVWT